MTHLRQRGCVSHIPPRDEGYAQACDIARGIGTQFTHQNTLFAFQNGSKTKKRKNKFKFIQKFKKNTCKMRKNIVLYYMS
jgi:hypothetical protein